MAELVNAAAFAEPWMYPMLPEIRSMPATYMPARQQGIDEARNRTALVAMRDAREDFSAGCVRDLKRTVRGLVHRQVYRDFYSRTYVQLLVAAEASRG